MKDLRIIFMGTPDFAVATLKTLVEAKYNIVGVITAPDKPAGRGQKLNESAVKQYAVAQNLTILQPKNLKNEAFLNELKALNANLQIVVAFRMLPKVVWQMPIYGTPIQWAIINGETKTGVSTFFINEEIDTGDMILQESVEIKPDENAGSLHDKLMTLGSALVLKTVKLIENETVNTIAQKDTLDIKTAYKLNRDNCKINWNDSLEQIYNLIRGLSPYPAAWCTLLNGNDTLDIKIYVADKEQILHNHAVGTIISSKKELKVAVSNGYIIIEELKLPGKRTMDVKSLLNGYTFEAEAKML